MIFFLVLLSETDHPLRPNGRFASDICFTVLAKYAITCEKPGMNSKHRKTLQAIFREPVPSAIAWNDIESLFVACGCKIIEGDGSRVRFEIGEVSGNFHRPHPSKEAKKYQVRIARAFLIEIGVEP
jgi:hypothetical protein